MAGRRKKRLTKAKEDNEKRVEKILDIRWIYNVQEFKVKWLSKDEHVVEEIQGEQMTEDGLEFIVKWKGHDQPTEEPEENLTGCNEVIGKYLVKKYSDFIKDVVLEEDDDEEEEIDEGEWVPAAELKCPEEIRDFFIKWKTQPIVDTIIGPSVVSGEMMFLVKYHNDDMNHTLPLRTLKEKFPDLLVEYLEQHLIFLNHIKEDDTSASDDGKKERRKTRRGRPKKSDGRKKNKSKDKAAQDDEDDSVEYDETDEFIVEKILEKRMTEDERVEYLLAWSPKKDANGQVIKTYANSWEPVENLGCVKLLYEFEQQFCVGLKQNYILDQIIDIKENLDGQRFAEVTWRTRNRKIVPESEHVFYEVVKRKFIHHLLDYLLKNVKVIL